MNKTEELFTEIDMDSTKKIPAVNIQSDWNEVLRKHNGQAWISSKYLNEISVEGKLRSDVNDSKTKVSGCEEFQIVSLAVNTLTVKHTQSGLIVSFVSPMKTYRVHSKSINSVSASENALVVSSCSADKVLVWDSRTAQVLHNLVGHAGPVYKCRFFPSGVVILTVGPDTTLRIWSAETAACPVTLKGHAMAVTDVAIVERGRNIISVSKDGKAKLWDVGESRCLDDILSADGELNCCCLINTEEKYTVKNEREIGTSDKLLITGSETGSLYCHHVGSRSNKFTIKLQSAVNCCTVVNGTSFAIGCQDGLVALLSVIDGTKKREWLESASPVTSMLNAFDGSFIVGRQDGTCTMYSVNKEHEALRVLLTGSDCDPIRDLSYNGRWIFVGCRDSTIRKYDINQLSVHFK